MSADAIGSLFVALGIDTAAFTAGVQQVQSRVGKFASDLSKRLGALGDAPGIQSLQGALAEIGANAAAASGKIAAASVVALGGMSISAMAAAKELQNLSRLANATPEEFQRIAYAGEQVGISQEKIGDILKDVNDRVGDFIATGGGPMADFFERIAPKVGVTAEEFRKLSGPQALQLYVDSLEKANVNQQDFTFFMEAMASDSTALLPILRNGGAQAQAYGDRLAELGGIMGSETVDQLAAMRTALSEVGVVMIGVKNTLGAAFAPVVAALAGAFVSLMTEGSAVRLVFDGMAAVVGVLATAFADWVSIISAVVAAIWSWSGAMATAIGDMTGLGAMLSWLGEWFDGVRGFIVAAGLVLTAYFIPAMASAAVGVGVLVASFITLRGVMISTGIGAVVVLVGTLVNKLLTLVEVTGGWGGAFSAVSDVAVEVWQRIRQGMEGLGEFFTAAAFGLAAAFTGAFAKVISGFAVLTQALADGWNALMGSMGIESKATGMGADLAKSLTEDAAMYGDIAASSVTLGAHKLAEAVKPLESVAAINEKIASSAESAGAALGDGSGGGLGAGLDAAGKKAGSAKEKLSAYEKVMKSLREEAERLQATMGMTDLQAEIWGKQREGGVNAASAAGQAIAQQVTLIDSMQRMKDATERGQDALKGFFGALLDGADAARQALVNLLKQIAQVQFAKGVMGLIGMTSWGGGVTSFIGDMLGENANGTNNWEGGLSRVHERGGEIMNLPRGTQVIPHDISKRMADQASRRQNMGVDVTVGFDESGDLHVRQIAQREAGAAAAEVVKALPSQIQQYSMDPRKRA